ncbi:MAG: DUF456 domain-containing protein [Actinomycetota bacterium]
MVFLYWVLVLVMLVGIAGAVIPGIPGSSLILAAIVVWGVVKGFSGIGLPLVVAIAVLLLSIGVDFLATYWGAKQAGASKWGQIGALVGLGLGFLGLLPAFLVGAPLLGILVGALIGAFVGEFLYRRDLEARERAKVAFKAGVGILVGSIVGNLIQGILAVASAIVFLVTTWPPTA